MDKTILPRLADASEETEAVTIFDLLLRAYSEVRSSVRLLADDAMAASAFSAVHCW
ncbi:MAG: hypothetical protein GPOALKHO_000975 [Sodalis sp.]|uniref:hypothetical protein n=1 Tax=Sodalis sp. (in: enterobacteria) TaxID=1898979 RepID=UPI003872E833|nr:MAG: hypothetical protein GPOALKHO_000975 [Sodalis sp.]